MFGRYCEDCHNDADLAANLSFQKLQPTDVAGRPEIFEKVVRKLRSGLMPPPGSPRPDAKEREQLVAGLERYLDANAAERGPEPGRVGLHRLNRTEYATAVEQLLGLHIDARAMLPADTASEGFDNVAEALRVTPTHIDQYLAAARDISIQAVGERAPEVARADYRVKRGNNTEHVDGLPLGTRDGLLVEHQFPADGVYEFNLTVSSIPGSELRGYPYGWLEYAHELALVIDGAKVFSAPIGGDEDSRALDQGQIQAVEAIKNRFRHVRVAVKAGRRSVGAAFVARSFAEGDYLLQSLVPGEGVPDVPRLYGMEIIGPFDPTGHRRARPRRARESSAAIRNQPTKSCRARREILTNLAHGAFRRPVDRAGRRAAARVLPTGPRGARLRHRHPEGSDGDPREHEVPVSRGARRTAAGSETRLGVCGQRPRARLAALVLPVEPGAGRNAARLANDGSLHEPAVLEREVHRMLADPRSRSLVTNFAFQWLGVRRLDTMDPDPRLYPTFDDDLRRAFKTEMELYRRQHPARQQAQRHRSPEREAHVRQRATCASLRLARRARRSVPPRGAHRLAPLRPVRQRQRADGHVVPRSHVARAARCVGARHDPGLPADTAAGHRVDRSHATAGRHRRARCASGSHATARCRPATTATA